MRHLLAVAAGGAVGVSLRWLLAGAVQRVGRFHGGRLEKYHEGLGLILGDVMKQMGWHCYAWLAKSYESNRKYVNSRPQPSFGRIYEYFLGSFALSEGRGGGEFFTPTAIVKLIVEIIEPFHGRMRKSALESQRILPLSQ